jgi:hypothetical protein
MAYFAVLANNIVQNTIVADSKSIAEEVTGQECVEFTESNVAGIGYIYDPETTLFSKPEQETITEE